jgi:integrase
VIPKVPKYPRHAHKSGQARVRLDGRDTYLGRWGSAESHENYRRLVAEHLTGGTTARTKGPAATVADLAETYCEHARSWYAGSEPGNGAADRVLRVMADLVDLYGSLPAADFDQVRLAALRGVWLRRGLARSTINRYTREVQLAWKWAASRKLVPAETTAAVKSLRMLAKGKSDTVDYPPVRAVGEATIEVTLLELHEPVRSMVRLQVATGMRPGEVCRLRGEDIDRSDTVWVYRPVLAKTDHLYEDEDDPRRRRVAIGPKAQAIMAPWLERHPEGYVFRPEDGPRKDKRPSDHYRVHSYGGAIRDACARAKVPAWSPNQLRHTAATKIRRAGGRDAARVVLGHADASTTDLYAEKDFDEARRIAGEIG